MPSPKPLSEIKNTLEELLITDMADAISVLKGYVRNSAYYKPKVMMQAGRYSQISDDLNIGVISAEEHRMETARIRKALLDLISRLNESDITHPE
ncbi:MAG: hypothetical protein KDC61_16350 [Saprospiraceae bacterium]|nr:hypothetical protein [Saprospiraceae bacterium]MCB0544083.1 hypothetical protein [Saprospiraceae bacterium]MCB0576127.1 hypothetical protein [Saprospiraceae bacterium]MCB9307172.1 hypothetical protein [Lewinellaceae bacterium]MCB9353843.1 hypothetical protein [Lewinellaceae bacterium]